MCMFITSSINSIILNYCTIHHIDQVNAILVNIPFNLGAMDTNLVNYAQMVVGRMKQEHHFAILVKVATTQEEKELSVTMNVVSLHASKKTIRMVPVTCMV